MAMETEFTASQKRALAIATVVALAFGAYFLRGYFILIVVARRRRIPVRSAVRLVSDAVRQGTLGDPHGAGGAVDGGHPGQPSGAAGRRPDQRHGPQRLGLGVTHRPELAGRPKRCVLINDVIDRVPFLTGVDVTPEMLPRAHDRGRAARRRVPAALPAGRRGRPGRRRHRGRAVPLRVHLAAHQPRARADC